MVAPPETNETDENPIKVMSEEEIREYYLSRTFDFGNCEIVRDEDIDVDAEFGDQLRRLYELIQHNPLWLRLCRVVWDKHTDLVHEYFRNPRLLQNFYICKNRAFLKLWEIFEVFKFDVFKGKDLRTFHLCEGPGYFIEATYIAFLRHCSNKNYNWTWAANTLNPYFENVYPTDKLVDDSHIKGHEHRWVFGPSGDGDVKKLTEDYLINNGLAGSFDLVTADGSCASDDPDGLKEHLVSSIITAEVRAALCLLRTGGRLIIKVYRFCEPETRKAVSQLAENFSSIKAIKPMASRPGSCEKYLVCDGFGGKCQMDDEMMIACDEMFLKNQLEMIKSHCDSYENKKYDQNDKNKFLETMKPKLFSYENASLRKELQQYFPVGHSENASPWQRMYGYNLVRRLQNHDGSTLVIDNYLNTANVFDPDCILLDGHVICQLIQEQNDIFLTSDIELSVNDSLFVDAHAYHAILRLEPAEAIYYDLFENLSTTKNMPESVWRRGMDFSDRNVVVEWTPDLITVQHILAALEQGFDEGMDSFTLDNFHRPPYPPQFLSRLSASMFALFYLLFSKCEIEDNYIRWSEKKYPYYMSIVGPLLRRLRTEALLLPENTSIRSFVPTRILEIFHSRICYRNVVYMMQAKRQHEAIRR